MGIENSTYPYTCMKKIVMKKWCTTFEQKKNCVEIYTIILLNDVLLLTSILTHIIQSISG